jgi:hypothetical protein
VHLCSAFVSDDVDSDCPVIHFAGQHMSYHKSLILFSQIAFLGIRVVNVHDAYMAA